MRSSGSSKVGTQWQHLPLLFVVEGPRDVQFLRRLSQLCHQANRVSPCLDQLERSGAVIFLPIGGNGPPSWTDHLSRLGKAEFHLYDRESPPESLVRQRAIQRLDRRPGRIVTLTLKRSLENYLHPLAVTEVFGLAVEFGDQDCVAELVAQQSFVARHPDVPWSALSIRTRKRLREQAKQKLNTEVAERMTMERLMERDPAGEVISWFESIAALISGQL